MQTLFLVSLFFGLGYAARIVRPVRFLLGLSPAMNALKGTIATLEERLAAIEAAAASPPAPAAAAPNLPPFNAGS